MSIYEKNAKLYTDSYLELYVPQDYFKNNIAANRGNVIETLGIVFAKLDESSNNYHLMTEPSIVRLQVHETEEGSISVAGRTIEVLILKYLKDSFVMNQALGRGPTVIDTFLSTVMNGKLPKTVPYPLIITLFWKNFVIADIKPDAPSKILEMIITATYRMKDDPSKPYAQYFGSSPNTSLYDYETSATRGTVEGLSTFSGMVYEDIGRMITNGVYNDLTKREEEVSPLEKIIHY